MTNETKPTSVPPAGGERRKGKRRGEYNPDEHARRLNALNLRLLIPLQRQADRRQSSREPEGGTSNAATVDNDARWEEIQRIARRVAEQDSAPTEVESALCGAVTRAREWKQAAPRTFEEGQLAMRERVVKFIAKRLQPMYEDHSYQESDTGAVVFRNEGIEGIAMELEELSDDLRTLLPKGEPG